MKEGGHWYDFDGEARHTILSAKGEPRATTLRDARKFNWLPSVTTVMKVLAAPELDRWKQQQVLMASLTLPQHPRRERRAVYCARILEDAFKQVEDAADLGTDIHKALEHHFQGLPYAPEMEKYISPVKKWVAENNIKFLSHELRLVNPEVGYAGTTDALIEKDGALYVLDYKSRKTKPEYKITPWGKEPMQIAAYATIAGATRGVNLYISTTEPGRIGEAWYDEETIAREYEAFKHVCALWQHINNYKPKQ
jgi:ATP-dependent exoDNAse (exonuclease V) beta subunit